MNLTNPLGSVTAILAVLTPILASVFGCTTDAVADLGAKCTASFLSPTLAIWVTAAFAGITLLAKLTRPGGIFGSLFGSTAVVVPPEKAGTGTVTKAQVEAPK